MYGFNVMVFPKRFLKADVSIPAQSIQFALQHFDIVLQIRNAKDIIIKY